MPSLRRHSPPRALRPAASLTTLVLLATTLVSIAPHSAFAAPIPLALVSQWRLDETSGTKALDAVRGAGHANDGTLQNGASFTTANKLNTSANLGSLNLDGVDDQVSIPDAASLDFGSSDAMTISLWLRRTNTGLKHILGKRGGCATMNYQLALTPNVEFNSSTGGIVGTSYGVTNNVWTHLAVTYDGVNTLRIYADGTQVGVNTSYALGPPTADPLLIGGTGGCANQNVGGQIDEVRIYRTALSATDIGLLAAHLGDLDTRFDGDGKTTHDINGGDEARAIAVQPDGKIVVVGNDGSGDFSVVRYNPDGSLDAPFGSGGGEVDFDFAGMDDHATAVAIQPDGKIVVGGYATEGGGKQDFGIVRFAGDGTLDPSFNGTGSRMYALSVGSDVAEGLAIQPDGMILAAGCIDCFGALSDFAVLRVHTGGAPDAGFGGLGVAEADFTGTRDEAEGLALQADGSIVLAGGTVVAGTFDMALARFTSTGALDTTFDGDGLLTSSFGAGTDDLAGGVAIQPADGKIVAAGSGPWGDFAVARFDGVGGALDASFGSGGHVTTDVSGSFDRGAGMVLQPDGKIVVAGQATTSSTDFGTVRYNASGSLDPTFGSGGIVTTSFPGGLSIDYANGVALTPDGQIVEAGINQVATGDFAVVEYHANTCTMLGSSGNDNLNGTKAADVLCGGGGNDQLTGGVGDDVLLGGDGDDTLLGGRGNDVLAGGAGGDAAGFYDSGVSSPVLIDLSVGTAANGILGHDGFLLSAPRQSTVENISASPGNDQVTGDDRANSLDGRQGADVLNGGGGNDNLVGGLGVDTLLGGDGNDNVQPGAGADTAGGGNGTDTLKYNDVGAGVTADLGAGTSSEDATISGFENLSGSAFNDTFTGDSGPNVLKGNGGDDTLNVFDATGGNDAVDGGANGAPGDTCEFDSGIPTDSVVNCENLIPHAGP